MIAEPSHQLLVLSTALQLIFLTIFIRNLISLIISFPMPWTRKCTAILPDLPFSVVTFNVHSTKQGNE